MDRIFDKLTQDLPQTSVLAMGLTPPLEKYMNMAGFGPGSYNKYPQNVLDTKFNEYNDVLQELTKKYNAFYVDLWAQWPHDVEGRWELLAEGLHPSDAGYDKMTGILYAFLRSTVSVEVTYKLVVTWSLLKSN